MGLLQGLANLIANAEHGAMRLGYALEGKQPAVQWGNGAVDKNTGTMEGYALPPKVINGPDGRRVQYDPNAVVNETNDKSLTPNMIKSLVNFPNTPQYYTGTGFGVRPTQPAYFSPSIWGHSVQNPSSQLLQASGYEDQSYNGLQGEGAFKPLQGNFRQIQGGPAQFQGITLGNQ